MPRRGKVILLVVSWLAAVFRWHALFANSFHADEALFASWARSIAVWRDPLLRSQPVDKPPLLFYTQALFYPIQGPEEWAARLPGFIASLILVPLVGLLVWKIYGDELTAILAAMIVALSPFAIQFSATAFTDPLLTLWVVASCTLQVSKKINSLEEQKNSSHTIWSGLLFGLAIATKHQAWLFLPLTFGLSMLRKWGWRQWRRWLIGFLLILGLLFSWAIARTGDLTLWSTQITNFGGTRLIWSWELWPRLEEWVGLWRLTTRFPLFFLIFTMILLPTISLKGDPKSVYDHLIVLFIFIYFLLHWVLAVPVWDRYLLPVVPLVGIIMGRGLAWILKITLDKLGNDGEIRRWLNWPSRNRIKLGHIYLSVFLLLLFVQLPSAIAARNGRFPIGGQPLADQGASVIVQFLDNSPYGTVLYDHWFSWQWRYHLFDKRIYVSWFPHSLALIDDLVVFGDDNNRRYLALPNTAEAHPVERALDAAGFQLEAISAEDVGHIVLYQIVPEGTR